MGSQPTWANQTFDDDGLGAVTLAGLDNFKNENPNGTWTLSITDNEGNYLGTLRSWALDIATTPTFVPLTVGLADKSGGYECLCASKSNPETAALDLSDVELYLNAPNGPRVKLFSANTFSGENLGSVLSAATFDDEALLAIASGQMPYSGSFQPEGSLAAFNGLDPNGTWKLEIVDAEGSLAGIVESWSLEFAFAPVDDEALQVSVVGDVNGDGLDDLGFVVDAFAGETADPAIGQAFIFPGMNLPNNSGGGAVIASIDGLGSGTVVIADITTSGGSGSSRAATVLEIGGLNNILFRAREMEQKIIIIRSG